MTAACPEITEDKANNQQFGYAIWDETKFNFAKTPIIAKACITGYTQQGGSLPSRVCNSDGTWSTNITNLCIIKTCTNNDLNNTSKINELTDTNIVNNTTNKNALILTSFATSGTTDHGSYLTAISCETGYAATSNIRMKCDDGIWKWDGATNDSMVNSNNTCGILKCKVFDLVNATAEKVNGTKEQIFGSSLGPAVYVATNTFQTCVSATNCDNGGTRFNKDSTETINYNQAVKLELNSCITGFSMFSPNGKLRGFLCDENGI